MLTRFSGCDKMTLLFDWFRVAVVSVVDDGRKGSDLGVGDGHFTASA